MARSATTGKEAAPAVNIAYTKHGRGLFAAKRFRKGDVIGQIHGQIIVDAEYSSAYGMDLGGDRTLEPCAPFRFLNHSCDPNAEIFAWDDPTKPEPDYLNLEALRTIEQGEELTIDYAWPAHFAIHCGCTAAACRGWIVDPEELHLVEAESAKKPR